MTITQGETERFKYDQVSGYIMDLIDKGTLKPGDRVPSLRKLSKTLKVSISTINQAYLSLEDKGVISARPQSGFYINAELNQSIATPKPIITANCQPRKVRFGQLFEEIFTISNNPRIAPFAAAKPSMELMPDKALMRETKSILSRNPANCMDYCFPPGHENLRQQIALRYSDLGVSVSSEDIIITSGATEALSLSLQTVAKRGDVIAVESPTYFSVLRLIEKMGMLALEIDSDPITGINLDSLEFALDTMDITAMLIVPNFNNPSGSLMPETHKKQLVELLSTRQIPIIEDDVYGDLYFGEERPRILKTYDTEGRVLSCSSFSKTLAPGFRMGWVAADARYHDRLLEWKQATSSASPSLQQLATAEFLRSGQYDRHLSRLRKAFKAQIEKARFMVARLFPEGTRISDPQGGFVLWIELPRSYDCFAVYNQALEHHIGITPGMLFSATRKFKNYIRLNCGYPWTEETELALEQLATIIHEMNP
ncbi:MAG: PLP-dependent aminotransferase family protein [Gammaproteobacteria bacterium]|nr:PLP-dependent aminotransferase family protein [Gammaproteobacteria bacterium]